MTADWEHHYLDVNGVRLHYVAAGAGPLMLFLHGFPEFWYSWRYQLQEFAQDYRVVALDLRGYNDSDKPEGIGAYRMAELVSDGVGVIQGLGYDRCVLVGHDWGGAIAWFLAYAHPSLLDELIVMNLPHPAKFTSGLQTPQQLLRSWYIGFFQLPLLPEWLLQAADYWVIEQLFRSMAVRKDTFSDADIAAYKAAAAKPGALTAMVNYYRAILDSSLFSQSWGVLEVPTLLIWGEEDMALGKELTYDTENYVRDFHLRYIPNCSHWVQQEQPQLVNRHMREFLALEKRIQTAHHD